MSAAVTVSEIEEIYSTSELSLVIPGYWLALSPYSPTLRFSVVLTDVWADLG